MTGLPVLGELCTSAETVLTVNSVVWAPRTAGLTSTANATAAA